MLGETYLREHISTGLQALGVTDIDASEIVIERPKAVDHGDLSTNVAMSLASRLRNNPRKIASDLIDIKFVD